MIVAGESGPAKALPEFKLLHKGLPLFTSVLLCCISIGLFDTLYLRDHHHSLHRSHYYAASEEDRAALDNAIGVVGLKLLHLGYVDDEDDGDDLTIEDYREIFRGILLREIEDLDEMAAAKRKTALRMSVLRTTQRRVSDAALHFSINRRKMDVQFQGSIIEIAE